MGRVVDLHAGSINLVRVVCLNLKDGIITLLLPSMGRVVNQYLKADFLKCKPLKVGRYVLFVIAKSKTIIFRPLIQSHVYIKSCNIIELSQFY